MEVVGGWAGGEEEGRWRMHGHGVSIQRPLGRGAHLATKRAYFPIGKFAKNGVHEQRELGWKYCRHWRAIDLRTTGTS